MQCPYRNFQECIVEQCPACIYEIDKEVVIEGPRPMNMSIEKAIKEGYAWEAVKTKYRFVSCKLIEDKVQPVPEQKQIINNTQRTNVIIRNSLF